MLRFGDQRLDLMAKLLWELSDPNAWMGESAERIALLRAQFKAAMMIEDMDADVQG